MNQKVVLGKKIKQLREKQGLSRGEFCGGEEELTVRQLARIEAGESLPTLPKLEFIAERLGVSLTTLIDKKEVELPKRYVQLKQRIIRYATFNKSDRIQQKQAYFDEIYEGYYEKLPEEEQVAVDIQKAILDVHIGASADFGKPLIEDYFYQIPKKEEYTVNDLLTINLYMHCIFHENYDEKIFMQLFNGVIKRIDHSIDIELYLIDKILLTAASIFTIHGKFDQMIHLVNASNKIMQINQDYLKKPVIDMLEGKHYLLSQCDLVAAETKYIEAAAFAMLQGDEFLSKRIMEEWKEDLAVYKQHSSNA